MAETLLEKAKKKESSTLFKRMDDDKALLYLSKYIMKDTAGNTIPGIINITLNDCAVFAANVIAALGGSSEQIVVESEDKKLDTHYIEDFQRAAFASANERLRKQVKPQLDPFIDEQNCIRGAGAARVLFREKGGALIPDIMPMDTRYLTYEVGVDGFDFTSYKMTRDKADIESEYPEAKGAVKGNDAIVRDIWTPKVNEVWVEGKKVKDEENKRGYVPVCMQIVPLGSMLLDKDSYSHQGESIFFLIRDLIPELHRLVSITQTLNLAALKGAKQYASKEGTTAILPDRETYEEMGGMVAVDIGGGITLVPIADIKRAAMLLHTMIETRIQRGSLSNLDLGIMGNQPWSAVALIEIGEGRDQIFLPRLGARGLLKQDIAAMFTQQVIDIGRSVDLGTRGHKRTFDISKLDGEYETSYKYFIKSPTIDIARFSIAGVAERYYDLKTILSDILRAEDPEGIIRKRYYDMAEKVSPTILQTRIIKALIEEDTEDSQYEAELMSAEMGISVEQIMAGELPKAPETPATPKEPMAGILPLLGKGGGKTSARKAGELEATPREGEE